MIKMALDRFKFDYKEDNKGFYIRGLRNEWFRFWSIASPSLIRKLRAYLFGVPDKNGCGGKFMKDIIKPIKVTPLEGEHEVYTITTSTGNYVAYGLGSKNCKSWDAPWGIDTSGSSNLEELQTALRSTFMIRRLKKDVLTELPPKRRQIIPLPSSEVRSIIEKELEFYDKNLSSENADAIENELDIARSKGEKSSYEESAKNVAKSAKSVLFGEMSKLRHATALVKVPYTISYIEDALEQQDKVVVFAHHNDVIEKLADGFKKYKALTYYGKMSKKDLDAAKEKFQSEAKYRIIFCSITMAVGFDLTAASYALFVELDWRPSVISQCEDRLHRIGQMGSVLIQHLIFESSLDARMVKVIIEKQDVINQALG